jgi:hypothetical protein
MRQRYINTDLSHPIDQMLVQMLDGNIEEGRKICNELNALGPDGLQIPADLDPNDLNIRNELWLRHTFNRGWFSLNDGKYSEGMQYLEAGRFIRIYGGDKLATTAPLYNPEEHDLTGKTILIHGEGGLGDVIIHARFAKSLKERGASKVYLTADSSLASILSRIEGVDGVVDSKETNRVVHDYWVPGFSAGWVSGVEYDTMPNDPYLTVKEESREVWKNFFKNNEKRVKVGIRWAGNPKFEHQQFRKFPPQFLTQMEFYKDVQLYSFQKDHNVINLPDSIVDLQNALLSWEDTLAAIEQMDIMITSCTSVAHAAAAMGKETWVLVPPLPYHTWAMGAPESTTSPYYKCVKLYRKEGRHDWNNAFQRLYRDLEEKFDLEPVKMENWDRESKSLNLGCSFNRLKNAVNVDAHDIFQPDLVFDANQSAKWPWEDNTFDYIYALDIMQKLGHSGVSFTDIIKEMWRVSRDGAMWEISVPHPRCDFIHGNPTHVRSITAETFHVFDKNRNMALIHAKKNTPLLAFISGIDLEVVDTRYDNLTTIYGQMMGDGRVKPEDLAYAANHNTNVIESIQMMVQVHKPGRFSLEHAKQAAAEAIANL